MALQGVLPGTKIDIRPVQAVNRGGYSEANDGLYLSSVHDILPDGTLEITMPMRAGRMVLIPMGVRYEMVFTTASGLKRADVDILGRIRRDNFYLLHVKLTTALDKFQRREYYRLDCMMDLVYVALDERAGELQKMAEITELMNSDPENPPISGHGTILNISGGGMRFITKNDLTDIHYLLLHFVIDAKGMSSNINLIGEIIGETDLPEGDRRHSYRVKILYKDSRCQELIIRYIFETERMLRKKKMGV